MKQDSDVTPNEQPPVIVEPEPEPGTPEPQIVEDDDIGMGSNDIESVTIVNDVTNLVSRLNSLYGIF